MNLKSVISKIVIYQFWYDYLKPKYREKSKLYYMNTDSVIVYLKTEDIYVAIAKDVKKKIDTSNYNSERPLPKRKNYKVVRLIKMN